MANTIPLKRGVEVVYKSRAQIQEALEDAGPRVRSEVEILGAGRILVERLEGDLPWQLTIWDENGQMLDMVVFHLATSVAFAIRDFSNGERW